MDFLNPFKDTEELSIPALTRKEAQRNKDQWMTLEKTKETPLDTQTLFSSCDLIPL
jgi:hypothetical protein